MAELIILCVLGALLLAVMVSRMLPSASATATARRHLSEGGLLVDVRTPGEYASGHIEGALNIPLGELSARATELGAKDRPIVLYCTSGSRSAVAEHTLQKLGYTRTWNLGSIYRFKS